MKARHDHVLMKVGIGGGDAALLGAVRIAALASPASMNVAGHHQKTRAGRVCRRRRNRPAIAGWLAAVP